MFLKENHDNRDYVFIYFFDNADAISPTTIK